MGRRVEIVTLLCWCGHPADCHGNREPDMLGCSYEFNPATEYEAWLKSNYGACPCLSFDPPPVPGEPVVFGLHRLPPDVVKWTTESDAERERKFRDWVKGAPGDMV